MAAPMLEPLNRAKGELRELLASHVYRVAEDVGMAGRHDQDGSGFRDQAFTSASSAKGLMARGFLDTNSPPRAGALNREFLRFLNPSNVE